MDGTGKHRPATHPNFIFKDEIMGWYEIVTKEIYNNTHLVEADSEQDAVDTLRGMDEDELEESLTGSEFESMDVDEDNITEIECDEDWNPIEED